MDAGTVGELAGVGGLRAAVGDVCGEREAVLRVGLALGDERREYGAFIEGLELGPAVVFVDVEDEGDGAVEALVRETVEVGAGVGWMGTGPRTWCRQWRRTW